MMQMICKMIERRDKLAQMSRELAMEYLFFGFDYLGEDDKKRILFKQLIKDLGNALENQINLVEIYASVINENLS